MRTTVIALGVLGLAWGSRTAAAPVPKPETAGGLIVVHFRDHLRFLNESGREVKRYTPPKADGWPAWQIGPVSPDGTRVLLTATLEEVPGGYTRAVVAPIDGKGPLHKIPFPGAAFGYFPFWSPDGKHLIDPRLVHDGIFGTKNHNVNLAIDVATGRVEILALPAIEGGPPEAGVKQFGLTDPATYRRSLHLVQACSRKGDWYLTQQQEQEGCNNGVPEWTALVSRDGNTVRRVLDAGRFAASPVFSPDGARVIFAILSLDPVNVQEPYLFDGVFVTDVKDVAIKKVIARPSGLAGFVPCQVAWSPDGKRIAFGYHRRAGDDGRFEFRVVSYTPDGKDPRAVLSVTGTRDEVEPLQLEGWR